MYSIEGLTDDPKQQQTVILPNSKSANLYIEYKPMQLGWFLSLDYESFSVKNVRIVSSPNFFHQFKNLLPFGVACFVQDDQEPLLQQDFLSGRAKLYILDRSEVTLYEEILSGQVSA